MVRNYYQMPDQATQDLIASWGDSIAIIPDPYAMQPQDPVPSPFSDDDVYPSSPTTTAQAVTVAEAVSSPTTGSTAVLPAAQENSMVRQYYQMPDQATQDLLASWGDTIQIVPDPYSPAAIAQSVSGPDDSIYTTPGQGLATALTSLPPNAYSADQANGMGNAALAYYQAIQRGDVVGMHSALDQWNALRRVGGLPDMVPQLTDAQIAAMAPNAPGSYFNPYGSGSSQYQNPAAGQAGWTVIAMDPTGGQSVTSAPPGSAPVQTTPSAVPTDQTSQPGNPLPPTAPAGTGTGSGSTPSLNSQIEALGGGQNLTADQWDFYYRQITGQTPPAPESYGFTGDQRFAAVPFAVWWAAFVAGTSTPTGGTPSDDGSSSGSSGTAALSSIVGLALVVILAWAIFG